MTHPLNGPTSAETEPTTSAIDPLAEAATGYPETFPTGLSTSPSRRVAVLTCMDSRMLPSRFLGILEGEAHIIRNAGGVVTDDTLRSLTMSQRLLGTQAIMLIQHTRCGMNGLDDAGFRDAIEAEVGSRPGWAAVEFGTDLEENVRRTVGELRDCAFLPHRGDIRGFTFDVDSGVLTEVVN